MEVRGVDERGLRLLGGRLGRVVDWLAWIDAESASRDQPEWGADVLETVEARPRCTFQVFFAIGGSGTAVGA